MRLWGRKSFIIIDTNHDNSGKKRYMDQIRIVRQALLNRDWNEKIKDGSRLYDRILPSRWSSKPTRVFGAATDPCLGWGRKYSSLGRKEIYTTLAPNK